ncbi:MAG: hypothetical protein JKY87_00375 [Mariprofundus sp.]|nr:hypothetical protein [Mariprofundus sp.]
MLMIGLLVFTPAYAGVGMLGGGESLYNSNLSLSAGNSHWDGQRLRIPSVCKRRNASLTQGYEYGYSYFHTVFANVSFAYRHCGQDVAKGVATLAGQAAGLGDVQLGVRTRLNHRSTAAWDVSLTIPTGYDNNSPSSLGRGALGLALGLRFSSDGKVNRKSSWGWKLGSTFTYFFSSKGHSISSFAAVNYAFTESNFEQTGNFASFRISNSFGFSNNGVQRVLFFNQIQRSLTNSDVTAVSLAYSHAFKNGWSTNARIGRALFGRNAPVDYTAGWGVSYRWKD